MAAVKFTYSKSTQAKKSKTVSYKTTRKQKQPEPEKKPSLWQQLKNAVGKANAYGDRLAAGEVGPPRHNLPTPQAIAKAPQGPLTLEQYYQTYYPQGWTQATEPVLSMMPRGAQNSELLKQQRANAAMTARYTGYAKQYQQQEMAKKFGKAYEDYLWLRVGLPRLNATQTARLTGFANSYLYDPPTVTDTGGENDYGNYYNYGGYSGGYDFNDVKEFWNRMVFWNIAQPDKGG